MNLTVLLLTVACLHVAAKGVSQNVTFSGKNVSLEKVFIEIKEQTDYRVLYSGHALAISKPVTLDTKDMPLLQFLDMLFKDQPLRYSIESKTINVSPSPGVASSSDRLFKLSGIDTLFRTVRGRVLNENNEPVIASVLIKGSSRGTISDNDGYFELTNVAEDAILIIRATNIQTISVNVNGRTNIVVSAKTALLSLNEVVINKGYYTEKQRLSTGNVSKVDAKEIERQPVTSPLMALQGKVPGIEISPTTGAPGAAPKIRIRGEASLRTSKTSSAALQGGYPLYVIDGVIISSQPLPSQSGLYILGTDPLANINPSNIQSIEILKDADATSIYGSRGANGVILITTKKGNTGANNVEVNFYSGISQVSRRIDLLDTKQYLEMRREAYSNTGTTPSNSTFDLRHWDTTRNVNWQNELLGGTGKVTDAQLIFSGGNEQTSFRLGGGYHNESSFLTRDLKNTLLTGTFSLDHLSLNQRLTIQFSANYGASKNTNISTSEIISAALELPPHAPQLYNEDGTLNWGQVIIGSNKRSSFINPLTALLKTHISNSGTLISNATIGYKILDQLIFKTTFGFTETHISENQKNPIAANAPEQQLEETGNASFGTSQRKSWSIEPQLNYGFKIKDHSFSFLTGATFQSLKDERQGTTGYGYTSDALLNSIKGAAAVVYNYDDYGNYRYTALFARLGWNWKNKYLINFSGRRDGSSRFGPGKQFGNFGALGGAWIFSEEKIFSNQDILSFGKIRGSYGSAGNDGIGDYKFYDLYNISDIRFQNLITLMPGSLFNENFQWEVTRQAELALEVGLLKDRISLQASWYRKISSNQLVDYKLPLVTGFASILKNFEATIENKGWELSADIKSIVTKNFRWTTSINFSIPQNQLLKFPGIASSPYAKIYKVGSPLSITYNYTFEGIDPLTGSILIKDKDNNDFIDDNDKDFGKHLDRRFYGGVFNNMSYKYFSLSFQLQFANQPGSGPYSATPPGLTSGNQPVTVMNRWKKPGDITTIPKFTRDFSILNPYGVQLLGSDYNIVDASFISLKTITASFDFPPSMLARMKLSNVRIFILGQNLLTITDFIGLDPETGPRSVPQLRMVTAGIQIKL